MSGRREDQEYFWTPEWQADEQESLAEIAAGNGLTFEGAAAAIRWLQEGDDAD